MTDTFVLRVPCVPQYANYELHLEFDSYTELDQKIETLHHGLMAKLGALSVNAALLAKADPESLRKIGEWDAIGGAKPSAPAGPGAPEGAVEACSEIVKQELGATILAEYKTVAPWDGPPPAETRPSPPWAAVDHFLGTEKVIKRVQAASGGLNLDDF